MKNLFKIMAFLAVSLCFGGVQAVELSNASVAKTNSGFVLQLDLPTTSGIEYTSKVLAADPVKKTGARFYVDISPLTLPKKFIPPTWISDDQIKQIRWAQHAKDSVRIVFDLVSASAIPFSVEKNFKGVMIATTPSESPNENVAVTKDTPEIKPEPKPAVAENMSLPVTPTPMVEKPVEKTVEAEIAKAETPKQEPVKIEAPKVTAKNSPAPANVRKIRIILDAGHGGDDPGAHGKKGTLEKDVTLDIAKKVRDILQKDSKYDVFMTREADTTLQLLDRTKFANKMNGDLFVSIHANASPKRTSKGISTYFLNNADDQESLRVAMRENGELDPTVLKQPSKNTDDYYLEVMKASMVKNFHTTQSTDLARAVQQDMLRTIKKDYSDIVDLGVRSARFYVLTGATMPAILVETSFISNPVEEKRLADRRYQQTLSEAIVNGVETFFKNRPAFEDGHNVFLSEEASPKVKTTRRN